MDLQLRKGRSAHYCFVTDACAMSRKHAIRGQVAFNLEFVRAVFIDKETGEVDNVPEGVKTLTLPEFAAWWAKETEWRVESV